MKPFTSSALYLVGFAVVGFAVGFGVGQKTREVGASNVTTNFDGGVVTIKADVAKAVTQGATDYIEGWF